MYMRTDRLFYTGMHTVFIGNIFKVQNIKEGNCFILHNMMENKDL